MLFRNLVIAVAIFGLGWGASFGAGVAYGKRTAAAPVQAAAGTGAAQAQGGLSGGGQAGLAGLATQLRAAIAGTVDSVDGQTLVLNAANNQKVRVTLTGQTQIIKQVQGAPADLVAGTRVTVQPQGQPAADGTVTAAAVTLLAAGEGPAGPPGAAAAAQGGQRPGPGGQGGQPPRPGG